MESIELFSFFAPTRIEYGAGKVNQLIEEVKRLNSESPLIVTDKGLVNTGIIKKIKEQLEEGNFKFEVYPDVESNPKDNTVEEVADLAKGCRSDLIIAVGGGSPMDVGKAASILITNGGRVHDYFGFERVEKQALPLIAVPTTAGTGSEVTCWSIITDTREEAHVKEGIGSSLIYPKVALVDPQLTLNLPPKLTAFTGMDALAHAIEAYLSVAARPITDALALYAISLISNNLAPAVLNGKNLQARDHMMLGSMMAGVAFSNSDVTAAHSLGEAIGGLYDTHHGLSVAILLPYFMEYNLMACPDRFVEIARAMGESISGISKPEAAMKSVNSVTALMKVIRIPTLKDLDVLEQDFERLSEIAVKNPCTDDNPRIMTKEDFLAILKNAYEDEMRIGING